MKKTVIYSLMAAAVCMAAVSCAKNAESSAGAVAQEYLGLWMNKYHPGINISSTGVYILEDEPGTGAAWNSELGYTFMQVTIRSLNGVITSTGHEAYAKQLGTYVEGYYYGPQASYTANGYAGVEAVLSGMRAGGTRTAVVPAWLITTDRYSSQQEYIKASSTSSSLIYTITFAEQANDITAWEASKVRLYAQANSLQSASFNDDTKESEIFWFLSDTTAITSKEPLSSGAKITINYTGRLLNGQVFDTTLEKVAKDNGIYSSSRTYEPVSVTLADSYENISMNGSTSLLDGFKGALSLMKYPGEKAIAVFTSALGYTATGSGSTIPSYAPLRFDFEIVSVSN